MSKGSTRRPTFISEAEEDAAWERTFGKPEPCDTCGRPASEHPFCIGTKMHTFKTAPANGAGGI